ncbi:MAG: type IV pilin N-terminal domain-containing protein [Methanoregula sp.]|nr:type IV pilin N-terminal domain-containing protein [Methanoregula sp.]
MPNHPHEAAVSEVMGSILMVAVTVIFAMLIGSTVLSLVGSMQQTRVVGFVAVRVNATFVTITYYGCDKPDQVYHLNISVNGMGPTALGSGRTPLDVGTSTMVSATAPGNDHMVVTGAFSDGTRQVVLNTMV